MPLEPAPEGPQDVLGGFELVRGGRERERGRESTCACWGLLRLQRQALQLLSGSDTGCYSALRFQVCVLCLATMLVARSAQHAVHGADEPAMELFLEEARASGSQRSEMEEAKMAIRDVDPPTDLLAVAADGSGGTDAAAERSGTATPVPPPGSGGTDAAAEPRGTATPVPPLLNDAPDDGAAVKASEPAAPAEGLTTPPAQQIAKPEDSGALGSGGQSSPSFQSGGGSPAEAAAAVAAAAVPEADGAAAGKYPEDEAPLASLVDKKAAVKAAARRRVTKGNGRGS